MYIFSAPDAIGRTEKYVKKGPMEGDISVANLDKLIGLEPWTIFGK